MYSYRPIYIKNTLSVTGSTVQKGQLCVGKAEVGASRGECVLSVQNNSWLQLYSIDKPPAFFFFFSSSSL